MAWTIQVLEDADSTGAKTVMAAWTEAAGVFAFSKKVNQDAAGINAFIAAVISDRNAWQAEQSNNIGGSAAILTDLIAADV